MIRLGFNQVALYPNNGILFQNSGGTIEFNGRCHIGNASAIAIGKKGHLVVGNSFLSTAALKIACQHKIVFEENVLCGWESTFVDTDFHQLTMVNTKEHTQSFAPIHIGRGCWFAAKSMVLKGTILPEFVTLASNSLVNKEYDRSYTLLAGSPAKIVKEGIFRDCENDSIVYPEINSKI